jgi:hypothetical protein
MIVMKLIYLDQNVCAALDVDYYKPAASEIYVSVNQLLEHRAEWDRGHRELLASFLVRGDKLHLKPSTGPGWWSVENLEL